MSWHFDNIGNAEQLTAAVDEAAAAQSGMPASVAAYIKDVIAACKPPDPAGYLISVRSMGHRPLSGGGSTELCEVKLVKSGPWKLGPAA